MKSYLTRDQVSELVKYDPETGDMWRISGPRIGRKAGSTNKLGYTLVTLNGENYLLHRLALLLTNGEWPQGLVDHIDGDPTNNKLSNLREVSHSGNMRNRKLASNNTSGVPNVYYRKSKKKWVVFLCFGKKRRVFGHFDDLEFAGLVAQEARRKYFGEDSVCSR